MQLLICLFLCVLASLSTVFAIIIGTFLFVQFLSLFYHKYPSQYAGRPHPYMMDLREEIPRSVVTGSLTFHHIKEPHLMYRMAEFLLAGEIEQLRTAKACIVHSMLSAGADLKMVMNISNSMVQPPTADLSTMSYVPQKPLFPRAGKPQSSPNSVVYTKGLFEVQVMSKLEENEGKLSKVRTFTRNKVMLGLRSGTPVSLAKKKLFLLGKKHVDVKAALWLWDVYHERETLLADVRESSASLCRVQLERPLASPRLRLLWPVSTKRTLHVILPVLPEMATAFMSFVRNFRAVTTGGSSMGVSSVFRLCVVIFRQQHHPLFINKDFSSAQTVSKTVFSHVNFLLSDSQYSPVAAVSLCSEHVKKPTDSSALDASHILLTAIDVSVTSTFIDRCHTNAVMAKEVFFPIVKIARSESESARSDSWPWMKSFYPSLCLHTRDAGIFERDALRSATIKDVFSQLLLDTDIQVVRAFEPSLQVTTNFDLCKNITSRRVRRQLSSCHSAEL